MTIALPPWIVLDSLIQQWLLEDIGRGDRTTAGLQLSQETLSSAHWIAKEAGVIAGLPVAARVFYLLDTRTRFQPIVAEGQLCQPGDIIARLHGSLETLLTGERVALNLAMGLSGIATTTRRYVERSQSFRHSWWILAKPHRV